MIWNKCECCRQETRLHVHPAWIEQPDSDRTSQLGCQGVATVLPKWHYWHKHCALRCLMTFPTILVGQHHHPHMNAPPSHQSCHHSYPLSWIVSWHAHGEQTCLVSTHLVLCMHCEKMHEQSLLQQRLHVPVCHTSNQGFLLQLLPNGSSQFQEGTQGKLLTWLETSSIWERAMTMGDINF